MKIANILGLYLGCKVKLKSGHIFPLHGVYKNNGMFKLNKRSTFNEPLKNCKLLLTPLPAITEEHKREFERTFLLKNWKVKHFENTEYGTIVYFAEREIITDRQGCNNEMVFWLASKGYDIGIVEDEYKEVTE